MHRIRVGVLRGGPSSEYDVSLKTGASVIGCLPEEKYDVKDIFISKEGIWHRNGFPISLSDALSHVDVIFNALHGQYGEDGKVQHLLEMHNIPFTGSGAFASSLGMNKVISKDIFKKKKIKTPYHKIINKNSEEDKEKEISPALLLELFRSFPLPIVVKPASAGSSVGVALVKNFDSFGDSIMNAFMHSDTVLIEEFIPGIEATVGVIDGYRDQDVYALPAIEIRPHINKGKSFFDYDAKYANMSDEIVPGNFSSDEKEELENIAKRVHKILGLKHYSRTDFIVNPKRGIYVLETNTLPGLTDESLIPKALNAVGSNLAHFVEHVLTLALERK